MIDTQRASETDGRHKLGAATGIEARALTKRFKLRGSPPSPT